MRMCIANVKPDAVVHLGDYYDDGGAMAEEFGHLRFHQVPGNCDRYRCIGQQMPILCYDVCGVRLYMTHGHLHGVKSGIGRLVRDAEQAGAAAALYGHTHGADCHQEENGMWVLNPGSCGSFGGSCGVIEAEDGKITVCRILRQADLEELT